jgi:hypothetical protein
MSTSEIKPTKAPLADLSREDIAFAAKATGLVDHEQLMRLISVDAQVQHFGTTDVTGMSDNEFLTHVFE